MNQRLDLQYYEILGVTPSASLEEIEQAYKKACQIYSPENPEFANSFGSEEAVELRGWVEEAYNILVKKMKSQTQFIHSLKTDAPKEKFQFETDDSFDIGAELENELLNTNFFDGLLIKKIRLKKNVSLNYIANKTCIGVHHLIAIEANDFDALPAAVFVRSYVKQIAQILELNTKEVCESYMKLYTESRGEF
ncbi:MAG: helix-turn-helix domain-containing protein [Bdellovibrionota bacterium]